MTKTLTEQWKDGELDGGYYYLIMEDETLRIDHTEYKFWNKTICWEHLDEHFVKEVLAPVPSYEEYNELKQDNKYLKSGIETRDKQIEQLQKRLAIATKALKEFKEQEHDYLDYGIDKDGNKIYLYPNRVATKALKEMEGVK